MEHEPRREYQPSEKWEEQPQSPQPFTPEDLDYIRRQMHELAPTIEDRGPTYYYLDTKQRIMEDIINSGRAISPDRIAHQLAVTLYQANVFQHQKAYRAVTALRFGFFAALASHDPALSRISDIYPIVRDYNEMQRQEMKQTGQFVEGVTLNKEQSQMLAWILDQGAIHHELPEAETSIPFASLEGQLQEATVEYATRYPNYRRYIDHEDNPNVQELLKQWNQQDNQES